LGYGGGEAIIRAKLRGASVIGFRFVLFPVRMGSIFYRLRTAVDEMKNPAHTSYAPLGLTHFGVRIRGSLRSPPATIPVVPIGTQSTALDTASNAFAMRSWSLCDKGDTFARRDFATKHSFERQVRSRVQLGNETDGVEASCAPLGLANFGVRIRGFASLTPGYFPVVPDGT